MSNNIKLDPNNHNNQQVTDFFTWIPQEIHLEIFSYLDAKDLQNTPLVAREWRACTYLTNTKNLVIAYKDLYHAIEIYFTTYMALPNATIIPFPKYEFPKDLNEYKENEAKKFQLWVHKEFHSFYREFVENDKKNETYSFLEWGARQLDCYFFTEQFLPMIAKHLFTQNMKVKIDGLQVTSLYRSIPTLNQVALNHLILANIPLPEMPQSILLNPNILRYSFRNNQLHLRDIYAIITTFRNRVAWTDLSFHNNPSKEYSLFDVDRFRHFVEHFPDYLETPSEDFYLQYFLPSATVLLKMYSDTIFGKGCYIQFTSDSSNNTSYFKPDSFPDTLPTATVKALLGLPFDETKNPFAIFIDALRK